MKLNYFEKKMFTAVFPMLSLDEVVTNVAVRIVISSCKNCYKFLEMR